MRVRAKCLKRGHKVKPVMVPLPFVFCVRWFCDYSEVASTYPISPSLRAEFEETVSLRNEEASQKVVGLRFRESEDA